MSDLERVLSLAREQIGVAEQPPGSNNVIYNTDYYGGPVQGSGYPWCCSFIWWLFDRCGLSALFCGGQKTAYCPFVVDYARQHGQWVDGDYRPGDLLLYDWDGDGVADHIGICESALGQSATAIEGNYQDKVSRVTRSFVGIMGACRPAYQNNTGTNTDSGNKDTISNVGNSYTVKPGDTLWGIAQRFGTTINALVSINGIQDPNRIWPGQVLKLKETDNEEPKKPEPQTCSVSLPVLKRGDVSLSVKAVQSVLVMRGFMINCTGDFDDATFIVIKGFQASAGIGVSGTVDGKTWEALLH